MMKRAFTIASAAIGFFLAAAPALADYVLILKNGRRITVQNYREDAGMIKFYSLGGEMGISKDQIRAIRPVGEQEAPGFKATAPQPEIILKTQEPAAEPEKVSPPTAAVKPPSPEETAEEQRTREEKEYRQRVEKITGEIKRLRDQYAAQTTGVVGPEPGFFTSEEAFRAHQADLLSRLRDAQNRAQGLETGSGEERPPLSLNAPPAYTEEQRRLSDLRSEIIRLENERRRLIEEMQQKGFATGDLFFE